VWYELEVRNGKSHWTVRKRFQDFYALSVALTQCTTSLEHKMPPKTLLRLTDVEEDKVFLDGRKDALGLFLDDLLSTLSRQGAVTNPIVLQFLGISIDPELNRDGL
jgi:PX domain